MQVWPPRRDDWAEVRDQLPDEGAIGSPTPKLKRHRGQPGRLDRRSFGGQVDRCPASRMPETVVSIGRCGSPRSSRCSRSSRRLTSSYSHRRGANRRGDGELRARAVDELGTELPWSRSLNRYAGALMAQGRSKHRNSSLLPTGSQGGRGLNSRSITTVRTPTISATCCTSWRPLRRLQMTAPPARCRRRAAAIEAGCRRGGAAGCLADDPDTLERIERVLALADGFESAYGPSVDSCASLGRR